MQHTYTKSQANASPHMSVESRPYSTMQYTHYYILFSQVSKQWRVQMEEHK